jgi:hypothetical protein
MCLEHEAGLTGFPMSRCTSLWEMTAPREPEGPAAPPQPNMGTTDEKRMQCMVMA